MLLNVIQMHNDIQSQIDFVNNPRHNSRDYDKAINLAIEEIVNDRYDNIKQAKGYSFDSVQRVKDELRTLVVSSVGLGTPEATRLDGSVPAYLPGQIPPRRFVPLPKGYKHSLQLLVILDGKEVSARAVSYDELSGIMGNAFTSPDADEPVFVEGRADFRIYYGSSTFTSYAHTYLKSPNVVSAGRVREQITAGVRVIAEGLEYLVVTDGTTHNSITYEKGEVFAAANNNLTSGQVVLRLNTMDTDLPATLHKEITNRAAAIMEGWVDDFESKKFLEFDANKS